LHMQALRRLRPSKRFDIPQHCHKMALPLPFPC
jgi:hypothetical protein